MSPFCSKMPPLCPVSLSMLPFTIRRSAVYTPDSCNIACGLCTALSVHTFITNKRMPNPHDSLFFTMRSCIDAAGVTVSEGALTASDVTFDGNTVSATECVLGAGGGALRVKVRNVVS